MFPEQKKKKLNSRQRKARKKLLEAATKSATDNTPIIFTPPPESTPVSTIPTAPTGGPVLGGPATRYASWTQDSNGNWVGQGTQTKAYREIRLRTATDVGLVGPDGSRYADVGAYAAWKKEAMEADIPDLDLAKPVDMIRRIAASLVEATTVIVGRLTTVKWGKTFYLPGAQHVINLTSVLNELASGQARTSEHANSNTRYGNNGGNLAEYCGERFLEFGWYMPVGTLIKPKRFDNWVREQVRVGRGLRWENVNRPVSRDVIDFESAPGTLASIKDRLDLTQAAVQQGKKLDVGLRLIISQIGDVYFTPDHYTTFYRYSEPRGSETGGEARWVRVAYWPRRTAPDESWYWPGTTLGSNAVWALRNW